MKRKILWLIMAVIAVLFMVPVGVGKVYASDLPSDLSTTGENDSGYKLVFEESQNDTYYLEGENEITPSVKVYYQDEEGARELLSSDKYTLKVERKVQDQDTYVESDFPLTYGTDRTGLYRLRAVAKEGSGFTGETSDFYVKVIKKCKITFYTNGGDGIEPYYVIPGGIFSTYGITPKKDGYFFEGWYLDEELTKGFYTRTIDEDISLYARWSAILSIGSYDATNEKDMAGGMFSVTEDGYESEPSYGWMVSTVNPGETRSLKAYPDKGNVFKGWYEGRVEDIYKDGKIYTQIIIPKDLNDPSTLISEDITYEKEIDQTFIVCAVFEKCKDHKLGEELVKKATFTEDGYTYSICEICGGEEIGMPILKGGNVSLEATSFEYTGKAVTPKVTVTNYDGELPSDYYDVEYKDNVNPGTAKVIVTLKGKYYEGSKELTFEIKKADSGKDEGKDSGKDESKEKSANTLNAKPKTATVKYNKLKKKTQKLAATKVIKFVNKGQGKLSYKLVSAKKGKKNFKKYIKVNSKTGKVTVKKGLKKGIYKVKIKVKAAGNAKYKASSWKTLTFKIKVK